MHFIVIDVIPVTLSATLLEKAFSPRPIRRDRHSFRCLESQKKRRWVRVNWIDLKHFTFFSSLLSPPFSGWLSKREKGPKKLEEFCEVISLCFIVCLRLPVWSELFFSSSNSFFKSRCSFTYLAILKRETGRWTDDGRRGERGTTTRAREGTKSSQHWKGQSIKMKSKSSIKWSSYYYQ